MAEYSAGRTPNPCVRCNEKIKFAAVLDRAMALGFDAVCTGHHARIEDGLLRRSVDQGKDQSYVLAVLTRDQLAHAMFPLGDTTKAQVRIEAAQRGLGVADKPDSHDVLLHRRRRHPRLPDQAPGRGPRPDRGQLRRDARQPRRRLRLHRRPAPRPAPGPPRRGRPPPLRPRHRAGHPHGHGRHRRGARSPRHHRPAPGLDRLRPAHRRPANARSSSAPTARSTLARPASTATPSRSPWPSPPGAWPPARPPSSTTATPSWPAPPSPPPALPSPPDRLTRPILRKSTAALALAGLPASRALADGGKEDCSRRDLANARGLS